MSNIHSPGEKIVTKGHPALEKVGRIIEENEFGTTYLNSLIETMKSELNSQEDGVAIAAPQVGESVQIFVVSRNAFHKNTKNFQLVYINPKIIKTGKETEMMLEGCLSVRWLYGDVERHKQVMIEFYDEKGVKHTRGATGLLAQIFQHEIDHLNGILFDSKAENLRDLPPDKINEYNK